MLTINELKVEGAAVLWQNGPMLHDCQKHLESVHESYFQHLKFATCFGLRMIGGGLAAILHGIFPAIFEHTGSKTLFALNDELKNRLAHCETTEDKHG